MRRIAQDFAIDLVKERAFELGKQEWLVDPGAVRRSKPSTSEAATSLSSRSTRISALPPQKKKKKLFHFFLWLDATGNVLYLTYSSEKDEQHAGG